MSRKFYGTIVLALALALPMVGCGDSTGAEGDTTLTVLLTDAAGDLQQAWVTIDRVELMGEGGSEPLMVDPITIDLIAWANDAVELVEKAPVPEGSYAQLRLVISEGCLVTSEGQHFASSGFEALDAPVECGSPDGDLQMPSYAQSGLKINLPGGLLDAPGDQALLLDFVVPESFSHQAGNAEKWVMHPVIKADDARFTGTIRVELIKNGDFEFPEVDPDGDGGDDPRPATLADFQALLTGEMPMVFEAGTDPEDPFTATFFFLVPDTYVASVGLVVDGLMDFTVNAVTGPSVDLGSGETQTVQFELTCAALAGSGDCPAS